MGWLPALMLLGDSDPTEWRVCPSASVHQEKNRSPLPAILCHEILLHDRPQTRPQVGASETMSQNKLGYFVYLKYYVIAAADW